MQVNRQWGLTSVIAIVFVLGISPDAVAHEKLCDKHNLSGSSRKFCDSIAFAPRGIPAVCNWHRLSDKTRRLCDRFRFADEPHYNVVRLAPNGAVRSVHLFVTETGKEMYSGYPHGIAFAAKKDDTREFRMSTDRLERFLRGRPTPGQVSRRDHQRQHRHHGRRSPGAPTATGYATGLPIGWNNSTGATPGQCLNYTINTPSNNVEQSSFSSSNAASSAAEQINASATVSGGVDGFSASANFSYSDAWSSSSNTSNQYYNFYSLYDLASTVSADEPLNAQGQAVGASASTLCGGQYMASVTVGMVATITLSYGSTSSSTQSQISTEVKGSDGLYSVSAAVDVANSAEKASSYFEFTMQSTGGGTQATADLSDAFAKVNPSNVAYYASCAAGNSVDCTAFSGNMGIGASNALSSFNELVKMLSGASNPDLSFFETFPAGVAGADTQALVVSMITTPAVLDPYASQLQQYLTLMNQVATLNNRIGLIQGQLTTTPSYNPVPFLDLLAYVDPLENIYAADRKTLLTNLQKCLAATSDNVVTVCAPIIDNQVSDAFAYYAASPTSCAASNRCFFAQQNTLALQYTGLALAWLGVGPDESFPVPLEVIYVDELPSFAVAGYPVGIAGEAGFVGFADRPFWIDAGADPFETENGYVAILALKPGDPLSTSNVSSKAQMNPPDPSPFVFWEVGDFGVGPFAPAVFTSLACTPSFADPCAIDYEWTETGFIAPFEFVQIEGLFE